MMKRKKLTQRQQQVLDALTAAGRPQSAYTLLDTLRDQGFRVPLQIYRALNALIDVGMVHKLESINSFVACAHGHPHGHGMAAFTICDQCGRADEFADDVVEAQLKQLAHDRRFQLSQTIIEMRGTCEDCSTTPHD